MKFCSRCETTKPRAAFAAKAASPDGLQAMCRECKRKWNQAHYKENTASERTRTRARRVLNFTTNARVVRKMREETACADCNQHYPWPAMQFDHVGTDKEFNVSEMIHDYTLDRIMNEIAKCEIVCANCHALRTHNRSLMV